MIRRLNYTRRVKVKGEDVELSIRSISGGAPVATAAVELDSYEFPPDADVVVEAYRKATYLRARMGSVAERPVRFDFALRGFDSPEGIRFRIKIVGKRPDLAGGTPLLLGVADQICPIEGGDTEDSDFDKLLRIVPAELNGEVWRLDCEDGPVVQIERAYWDERSFVRHGWFLSMVAPTVLRESLREALADNYRETEGDDWRAQWIRLALTLPGDRELPGSGDDVNDWINARVEAFCRKQKLRERFDMVLRGSDQ